jgi:transcriptional regulator with XRE-family HTH domain
MGSKPHATDIDLYVIEQVKKKRLELRISQLALSQALSAADSFVSNVESNKYRTKYNVRHLNEVAKIFKCSPKDFWPDAPL